MQTTGVIVADGHRHHENGGGHSTLIDGISVASSPLITRAVEIAQAHMEPYLFNHVMRSWLFSASLAKQRRIRYDEEVLAVSSVLHDIGLAPEFAGSLRFEVEGANFARDLATSFGIDARRCQLIWDSIALNSTPSLCLHKEAEVSLCCLGVGLDWGGWGYDSIDATVRDAILARYPRLGMKQKFTDAICSICEQRRESTYDNFARDFGVRYVAGYVPVSSVDALMASPFLD